MRGEVGDVAEDVGAAVPEEGGGGAATAGGVEGEAAPFLIFIPIHSSSLKQFIL